MNLLEKKIYSIVREVINEERGISDEVYNAANEILLLIRRENDEKLRSDEYTETLKLPNTYVTRGAFSFKLLKKTILVTYNSYFFQDKELYNMCCKKYPRRLLNASAMYGEGFPSLYVVYNNVGGEYDDGIYDRLQHEIEHCFQQIKIGGDLCSSKLRDAVDDGLKKKQEDIIIYMSSWILYCSRKYEQDACANGLYSWLKNGGGNKNDIVRKSAIVRNRRICIKYMDILKQYIGDKNIENRIHNFFGLTLPSILKKCDHTCEDMRDKANRIIYKYMEEDGERIDFVK